ncbi:MAG: 3-hydroxyacyl-CoA dehydrogenase family protein [Rhodospirillales bacterium]
MTESDGDGGGPIRRVLVAGAGVMGLGIAKSVAAGGFETWLMSRRAGSLADVPPGVKVAAGPPKQAPDLVIESVPEDLEIKRALYRKLETALPAATLIASNTSSLDLDALFAGMKHPGRFLGAHYFQPAEVFPMVEVIAGTQTDPRTLERVAAAMARTGKRAIVMRAPVVGFLINRIQHAILHEAYHLISAGACTVADVDDVARHVLGPRMCITGLIRQKDISGLGVHATAQRGIVPDLAHDRTPNPDVQALAAAGDNGLATGKGFYDWSGIEPGRVRAEATRQLNALIEFLGRLHAGENPALAPKPRDIRRARK